MSSTAYLALFQAVFGALGIVAMSCMTTISGRIEGRLNAKQSDGSGFLDKVEYAGVSTAGVSHEVYYGKNDRTLIEQLRWMATRWSIVYAVFLGLSAFLFVLRGRGIPMDDWAPLVPALGFTLWLVIETWAAFRNHLASVVESISNSPSRTS